MLMTSLASLVLGLLATGPAWSAPASSNLAAELRRLYAEPVDPWERWRHRARLVTLPGGALVARDAAYRDDARFVAAAASLIEQGGPVSHPPETPPPLRRSESGPAASPVAQGVGDDALLGAWLLGTVPGGLIREAEPVLLTALRHPDERVRFEATVALGRVGTEAARRALDDAEVREPPAGSAAARWAAERIRARAASGTPVAGAPGNGSRLRPAFCRGVNWWHSERRDDDGRSSFAALAALGVDWVSIHTWDPLQRGAHSPEWAPRARSLEIEGLEDVVKNAHAAGLKVMLKPHLEMRGYEPTEEERRVLRGSDEGARQRLLVRLRKEWAERPRVWHNDIEMKTEADWKGWFARYEDYVLGYARQAQAAGADAFCVGRETDKAAIAREGDWRRLIGRVREVFSGPLTYSANFDGYARIRFWDALDVIGISAYFPLSSSDDPSSSELAASWQAILDPLEAFAKARYRKVVFTEIGYPALATAARRPWDETEARTDVWLQARLYEAALRAVASREFMAGTFFWLWEGVSPPPFRDSSFSIQDKPASFVMAFWYRY